jgi:antitoxin component YwqK of YwqJK toxin-antitoxin module
MKKLLLLSAIALALSGCGKSEYTFKEVSALNDRVGSPYGVYRVRETDKPANGTIVNKVGDVVLQSFKVEDGRVVGEWKEYDKDGKLLVEGNFKDGNFVGPKKDYCKGQNSQNLSNESIRETDRFSNHVYDCATGLQIKDTTLTLGDSRTSKRIGAQREWVILDGKQTLNLLETFAQDGSGKLDGPVEHYDYKGVMTDRATYKDGELYGLKEEWRVLTDGTPIPSSKVHYQAGKREGDAEYYFLGGVWPAGTVSEKGVFKGDKKIGNWVEYRAGSASVQDFDHLADESAMAERVMAMAQGTRYFSGAKANEVEDLNALAYLIKGSQVDINRRLTLHNAPVITRAADNAYDYLLSVGADPMGRDINGNTRLMYCINGNELRCSVEHMIMLTAKEDLKAANEYGSTALTAFCDNASDLERNYGADKTLEVFHALIKGSDINARTYGKETPLHKCMAQRNHVYAQELVAAGADLNAKDVSGVTPVQMVFFSSYTLDSFRRFGWTPDAIKFAASFQGKSDFSFDTPVSGFDKSIRQIVLESGDTKTAMLIDSLVGTAKG